MIIVTEELINSLTREETMRLLHAISSSNTVYLDYYNQMCNGDMGYPRIKFELGFKFNQRRGIRIMKWRKLPLLLDEEGENNPNDNWKWENSVTPNSWNEFELELISIVRDRALNCILPK